MLLGNTGWETPGSAGSPHGQLCGCVGQTLFQMLGADGQTELSALMEPVF